MTSVRSLLFDNSACTYFDLSIDVHWFLCVLKFHNEIPNVTKIITAITSLHQANFICLFQHKYL